MSQNPHIDLDCIPDVHFSRHIIPTLLGELGTSHYDVFFVECGIPPDTTIELNPATDALAIMQRALARQQGTLDVYERLKMLIGHEPVCIDHPAYWAFSVAEVGSAISNAPRDVQGRPYIPPESWNNPTFRQAVIRYFEKSYIGRERWMIQQIKELLSLGAGKEQRHVNGLLLIGHNHVPPLEQALRGWCNFRCLVAFETVKTAVVKHHEALGAAPLTLQRLRGAQSLSELRRAATLGDMLWFSVPPNDCESILVNVAPDSIAGEPEAAHIVPPS